MRCLLSLALLCGCTAAEPVGEISRSLSVDPRRATTPTRQARLEGAGDSAVLREGPLGAAARTVAEGVLPRFSYAPDGRTLVYAQLGPGGYGEADLWALDVATGRARQLTALPGAEEAPRFVDARTVEFVGTARGLQSRFRVSLDEGAVVQRTNVGLSKTGPGLPAGYVSPWTDAP